VGTRFSGLALERQPTFFYCLWSCTMLTYLERCFDEKLVEIIFIYRSIYCYLCKQSCGRKYLCSKWYFLSTSSIQRRNLSANGKKCWNLVVAATLSISDVWCSCLRIVCSVIKKWPEMYWLKIWPKKSLRVLIIEHNVLHICNEWLHLKVDALHRNTER